MFYSSKIYYLVHRIIYVSKQTYLFVYDIIYFCVNTYCFLCKTYERRASQNFKGVSAERNTSRLGGAVAHASERCCVTGNSEKSRGSKVSCSQPFSFCFSAG